VCIFAFTIAGGFSSLVSTGIGDEVLLDGTNCALVNTQPDDLQANLEVFHIAAKEVRDAASYASQCYSDRGTKSVGVFDCNTLAAPKLQLTERRDAPCPFGDNICRSDSSNLVLDTGYIDSHLHLGINAPPGERLLIRNVHTCAPLRTDGFSRNFSTTSENYTEYFYGPASGGAIVELNHTLRTPSLYSQYMREHDNLGRSIQPTPYVL